MKLSKIKEQLKTYANTHPNPNEDREQIIKQQMEVERQAELKKDPMKQFLIF